MQLLGVIVQIILSFIVIGYQSMKILVIFHGKWDSSKSMSLNLSSTDPYTLIRHILLLLLVFLQINQCQQIQSLIASIPLVISLLFSLFSSFSSTTSLFVSFFISVCSYWFQLLVLHHSQTQNNMSSLSHYMFSAHWWLLFDIW